MKYQIPQTVFIQEIDDEIILLGVTTVNGNYCTVGVI